MNPDKEPEVKPWKEVRENLKNAVERSPGLLVDALDAAFLHGIDMEQAGANRVREVILADFKSSPVFQWLSFDQIKEITRIISRIPDDLANET